MTSEVVLGRGLLHSTLLFMPKKKGIKSRCLFSGVEISLVFPYVGRKFTFFSRPRSLESDAFSQNMGCLLVLNDEKSGANVSRHVASS